VTFKCRGEGASERSDPLWLQAYVISLICYTSNDNRCSGNWNWTDLNKRLNNGMNKHIIFSTISRQVLPPREWLNKWQKSLVTDKQTNRQTDGQHLRIKPLHLQAELNDITSMTQMNKLLSNMSSQCRHYTEKLWHVHCSNKFCCYRGRAMLCVYQ